MASPAVLVVGAGPAGSMAALVLARAGVPVRIIDRARFPRPKLCGDTLNPGALAILQRVSPPLADAVRARALPICGMTVSGPGGVRVSCDYPGGLRGAAISRHDLDLLLLDAAVRAGAVLDEGVSAQTPVMGRDGRVIGVRSAGATGERTWQASLIIAADGRTSKLASALRLSSFAPRPRRWAFGAYFEGAEGVQDRGEMHIRSEGYVGVAPLPGGIANVCVVRPMPRRSPGAAIDAHSIIARTLASEPVLRDRFARARQITGVTALGPLAIDGRAAGVPGLLLAGDAAGFIDPMTGDGLRFALRGGVLAAEAAMAEIAAGRPAWRALDRQRAREFVTKWRFNRALRLLSGSPGALTAATLLAARWALPVRYVIGMAGDISLVDGEQVAPEDGTRARPAFPEASRGAR